MCVCLVRAIFFVSSLLLIIKMLFVSPVIYPFIYWQSDGEDSLVTIDTAMCSTRM